MLLPQNYRSILQNRFYVNMILGCNQSGCLQALFQCFSTRLFLWFAGHPHYKIFYFLDILKLEFLTLCNNINHVYEENRGNKEAMY